MDVTQESAGEVAIIVVAGRMDAAGARQFTEAVSALVHSGRSRLLLDASRLEYIGSLGMRALLLAARAATHASGRLVLVGLAEPVRRVLELGGFGSSFEIHASRDDALTGFNAAP
jgi:anti-anti-sigma factor